MEAVIDAAGSVEPASIRVIASSEPRFNDAAKADVEQAHFTPGRMAGETVRVRFLRFRLRSSCRPGVDLARPRASGLRASVSLAFAPELTGDSLPKDV